MLVSVLEGRLLAKLDDFAAVLSQLFKKRCLLASRVNSYRLQLVE